ncbi:MAG: ATP-binding cassette domain-containing protein, partial [Cryobacterium sp.]
MSTGTVIEFSHLSKRFAATAAVTDLSFTVEPGRVTGFLGPNGAGKTTSLRILLGLVDATSGTATFAGVRYRDLPR